LRRFGLSLDSLAQRGFPQLFTAPLTRRKIRAWQLSAFNSQNPHPARLPRKEPHSLCTKFGHPPVNQLHSPENTPDKIAWFSLTLKIEGVKT
jgi:hypothetical protein